MKNSQIAEAYRKYLGPKCSKTTFYERIRKGMDISEAIKPVNQRKRYERKIKSTKFAEELEWYANYKGEKTYKQRYYQRLYQGRTKEEAILINPGVHIREKIIFKKKPKPKKVVTIKKDSPDYNEIRIVYKQEEAEVIKKEYLNMIEELENLWNSTDDQKEAKEILDKLNDLKREYQLFCNINQ